ncbi:MAG: hypothetical protein WC865_12105 [Bacteroidales bacterium]
MISRVYTFERFLQVLIEKQFYFISPVQWKDPWEAILFKELYNGNMESILPIYGSCWTLNEETDLAWRAYSPSKNGIMVFAEEQELLSFFKTDILHDYPDSQIIGKVVSYLTQADYLDIFRDVLGSKKDPPKRLPDFLLFDSLYVKRNFFLTESEFRFIIHLDNGMAMQIGDHFNVKFDPNRYFSKIILDPNLSGNDYQFYKGLITRLGYNGPIHQSDVYADPTTL